MAAWNIRRWSVAPNFCLSWQGINQAISRIAARALGFACQKLNLDDEIYLVGANAAVKETLRSIDILEEFTVVDAFDTIAQTQPQSR